MNLAGLFRAFRAARAPAAAAIIATAQPVVMPAAAAPIPVQAALDVKRAAPSKGSSRFVAGTAFAACAAPRSRASRASAPSPTATALACRRCASARPRASA